VDTSLRGFHIFEEWSSTTCDSLCLVAESIDGTDWNWIHQVLRRSGEFHLDAGWSEPQLARERLEQFKASTEQPPGNSPWIELEIPEPVNDGTFVVMRDFDRAKLIAMESAADCNSSELVTRQPASTHLPRLKRLVRLCKRRPRIAVVSPACARTWSSDSSILLSTPRVPRGGNVEFHPPRR
jgi:hypothetical protein